MSLHTIWRSTRALAIASALTFTFAACGSTNISAQEVSEPRAKMAAADEAGAQNIPLAALRLQQADKAFAKAKALMKDGEEEAARLYLQRAKVDAEVAHAMAHEAALAQRAQTALNEVDALRNQLTNQIVE